MSDRITYRGRWIIWSRIDGLNPNFWHFRHVDFDGDANDTRAGHGTSEQDCKDQIDHYEAEHTSLSEHGGPCQLCMSGSSLGSEKAQYVLLDGAWHPWPLVAALPTGAPVVRLRCHICDPDGYREDAANLNQKIAEAAAQQESEKQ